MIKSKQSQGFTLMEVMIVVAIVAILAAIAIPSYDNYITKSKRADAMGALLSAQSAVERYKASNNFSYVGVTVPFAQVPADGSGTAYYTIGLTNVTAKTYTLTATPVNSMSGKDSALSINQNGARRWGTKACWPESGNSC